MLTRDQILGAADFTLEEVDVPEWGGVVAVRTFSGKSRDTLESLMLAAGGNALPDARATVALLACCDAAGRPLFTKEDLDELGTRGAAALDRVFKVAVRLNGLGAAEVDARLGNSDGAQSADSGTVSL